MLSLLYMYVTCLCMLLQPRWRRIPIPNTTWCEVLVSWMGLSGAAFSQVSICLVGGCRNLSEAWQGICSEKCHNPNINYVHRALQVLFHMSSSHYQELQDLIQSPEIASLEDVLGQYGTISFRHVKSHCVIQILIFRDRFRG
jgi:hypothetical protein